jgi:osmoprotectant transport system substrate-binding protein
MPQRRGVLQAVCLALAVLCAACTSSGDHGSPAQAPAAGRAGTTITVGSFDFPESVLLACIYADALAAKGFPVRVLPDLGTRELVDPALMSGLIQIVPEYAGSALGFMSLGHLPGTSETAATYRSLARSAGRRGLVAAQPAPAQDANAIVVTAATARVELLGRDPRSVADGWLRARALIPEGRGVQ